MVGYEFFQKKKQGQTVLDLYVRLSVLPWCQEYAVSEKRCNMIHPCVIMCENVKLSWKSCSNNDNNNINNIQVAIDHFREVIEHAAMIEHALQVTGCVFFFGLWKFFQLFFSQTTNEPR